MTDVQHIETAVGRHDDFAVFFRAVNNLGELIALIGFFF
jgi:hypothetical protein